MQEKQAFIQEQIIDQNYNQSDFYTYLQSQTDKDFQSDDITFIELQLIVKQFQSEFTKSTKIQNSPTNNTQNKNGENNDNINQINNRSKSNTNDFKVPDQNEIKNDKQSLEFENISFDDLQKEASRSSLPDTPQNNQLQDTQNNITTNNNNNYNNNNLNLISNTNQQQIPEKQILVQNQSKYEAIIRCKQLIPNKIGKQNQIQIIIPQTYTNQKSKQVYFEIHTQPLNFTVQRKSSDFLILRQLFLKFFPGIAVPFLTEKKSLKSLKPEKIEKNKLFFENYLIQVLQCPDLKNSKIFEDFLMLNEEKYQEEVKKLQKVQKPSSITYIKNIEGKLNLIISQECKDYSENIFYYSQLCEDNFQIIQKQSKKIKEKYEEIHQISQEINQAFQNLSENPIYNNLKSENLNQNENLQNIRNMQNIYKSFLLQNQVVTDSIKDQVKLVNEHYYNFFKNQKYQFQSLKELVKTRANFAEKYFQKLQSSQKYQQNKSESVDSPSKDLNVLRDQFGFYNYSVLKEGSRILHYQKEKYIEHLKINYTLQKQMYSGIALIQQQNLQEYNISN